MTDDEDLNVYYYGLTREEYEEAKSELLLMKNFEIWSGMCSREEIMDLRGIETPIEGYDVREILQKEFERKLEAEKCYPEVTDVDRLEAAFSALEELGVVALHSPAFTQSHCGAIAEVEWISRGGSASRYFGAAHYNEQDVMHLLEGAEGFYISFETFTPVEAKTYRADLAEVARIAVEALQKQGLEVSWSGDVGLRVKVENFRWQKRQGAEPTLAPRL